MTTIGEHGEYRMFCDDTLAGKKILITGGGSGLGLGMAKAIVRVGGEVVLCGRNEEKLQGAKKGFSDPSRVNVHVCDVRDAGAVEELFTTVWPLDGLINNAAGNFYACSEDLTSNGFQTVVDIVLNGTFHCSQQFGKRALADREDGSEGQKAIVNIVTTYAHTGSIFVLPSACAKAGVLTMTKSLGVEWAPYGIRVNAIAPGPIPTEGAWKRLIPSEELEKKIEHSIPMRRFGTQEELANLAVFLLSDLSSYITAECVAVDGGEGLQGSGFNLIDQMLPREQAKAVFAKMKEARK
jgi:NAD(P)-dependent dehydrogenase (short-subunit alcohol dehydrogenase family)